MKACQFCDHPSNDPDCICDCHKVVNAIKRLGASVITGIKGGIQIMPNETRRPDRLYVRESEHEQ